MINFRNNNLNSRRREVVGVYSPQNCHENNTQVFCSFFDSASNEICSVPQGSPLICGDENAVSGFILNNCGDIKGLNGLDYHSVGDFREWIEQVSGAKKLDNISAIFIAIALLINVKTFL